MKILRTTVFALTCCNIVAVAADPAWTPPRCSDLRDNEKNRKPLFALLCQQELEQNYLDGFRRARNNHRQETGAPDPFATCIETYSGDEDGVGKLVNLIRGNGAPKASLILGPTFSGVYLGAIKQLDDGKGGEAPRVPVISPVVQAPDVRNERKGWFFRTNLNASLRVEAIMDFTEGWPITSITILYPNTDYGRLAEDHFRKQLPADLVEQYRSYEYKRHGGDRAAVTKVMDRRPEALGIFGVPSEMLRILRSVRRRALLPYRPLTFTIGDPSSQREKPAMDGVYYVSVVEHAACRASKALDGKGADRCDIGPSEIKALTFDTSQHVLRLAAASIKGKDFDAEGFRDAFVALLQSTSDAGSTTRMSFSGLENQAEPKIYRIEGGSITEPPTLAEMGLAGWVANKWDLLSGRFGQAMLALNLLVLVTVTVVIAGLDVNRSFGGRFRKIFFHWHFWLLCGFNTCLVLALYFYMGENETLRYDSLLAALAVAMGPSVLLRTTFFETPAGKAIGLAQVYDQFLLWINERMMLRRYKLFSRFVNVIAYYNPGKSLAAKLRRLYRNAKTAEMRRHLEAGLAKEIEESESYMEARLSYARRLLQRFEWDELREEFAPPEYRNDLPGNPAELINRCARYCQSNTERQKKLAWVVEEQIKARPKEVGDKLREDLQKELDDQSPSIYELSQVNFLVTRCAFTPELFRDHELLPKDFKFSDPTSGSFVRKIRGQLGLGTTVDASASGGDDQDDDRPTGLAATAP